MANWVGRLARRARGGAAVAVAYPDALLALGFDAARYRDDYPALAALTDRELAAHYHVSGRVERFPIRFALPLAQAQEHIARLDVAEADRDLLRHDVAAAVLHQADLWGRDDARLTELLRPSPAHRPMLVLADSHGGFYLTEDVLRSGRLLPAPFLCTGASARGLVNPGSRGGAGERIRAVLEAREDQLRGAIILLKFGQVDLEFVYDYRRLRDGRAAFDLDHATAFAVESAHRCAAFAARLDGITPGRLVVTAALPPALSDAALRDGYVNAHIVELHGDRDPDELRQGLQALEMPAWPVRTELARRYNAALAGACAASGLAFHDDFTPLVGADGVIDPALILWHGGGDHHLCFTSPAARRAAGEAARAIAAL